jgi:Streptomyces sporulation and cell division protein, SsgA
MNPHKFPATVLRVNEQKVYVPVQVSLDWDGDNDPLAVQMIFGADGEDDVVWILALDLLAEGAHSKKATGDGDIKLRDNGDGALFVCLRNREGHADVALPLNSVKKFLKEVGKGATEDHLDELIDTELRELLEEEA